MWQIYITSGKKQSRRKIEAWIQKDFGVIRSMLTDAVEWVFPQDSFCEFKLYVELQHMTLSRD